VAPAFENLTLWQRVYDHLRDEIMADRLPPGTELSEVALSRELSVSRGPIREAMGRLAAEGLVTVRPRRGAEVRAITTGELVDSYQVREALEVMAVRLATPRLTDSDLDRLEELVDSMAAHAKHEAVADFFAANVVFHELLCELSGNKKLQEVHHRLASEIGRFQAQTLALRGSLDGSVSEHRAILAAMRLGDVEKAAALTAAHVRVPTQRLQEALDGTGSPADRDGGFQDAGAAISPPHRSQSLPRRGPLPWQTSG